VEAAPLVRRRLHEKQPDSSVVATRSWDCQPNKAFRHVKNTFIHFDDSHHVDHRRCSSAPPQYYHNTAEARPCPHTAKQCGIPCCCALSHQEGPQIAEADLSRHSLSDPTNRRKQRPTKKKRNQYHKLMKTISDEMEMNPNGFDIESLQHRVPTSMRDNEWLLRKFLGRMETIHERLRTRQVKIQLTTQIQAAPKADALQISKTGSMQQLPKLEGGKLHDDVREVAAVLPHQGGVANKNDLSLWEQAKVRVRNTFIEIWVPEALPLLRTKTTPPDCIIACRDRTTLRPKAIRSDCTVITGS